MLSSYCRSTSRSTGLDQKQCGGVSGTFEVVVGVRLVLKHMGHSVRTIG